MGPRLKGSRHHVAAPSNNPQPSKHLRDRGDDGGRELESFEASNDSISRLVTMNRFDEEYWKQWTEVRGKEGKREEEVCVVGSK